MLHDNAEREYAYGPANGLPDTKVGTFSQSLMDEAKQRSWTVISMKNDWNRIFSDEKHKSNRMPPSARARDLVPLGMLPALLAPPVALADEALSTPAEADAAIHGTFNNGEDITLPRNLFQVRQRYERLPDAEGREPEKWVTTLRADLWTGFADGWKLYGRVDEPLVYSDDVTSSFNPNGHSRFGQGDLLTEIAIIAPPPTPRLGYGLGMRAVWPTAGLNEAGDGKYQVGPVAAARYSLPEISPGSFFLTQVLYLNSVASRNENKAVRKRSYTRKRGCQLFCQIPGDVFGQRWLIDTSRWSF